MTPMSGAQRLRGIKKTDHKGGGSVDDEVRYPVMDTWAIDALPAVAARRQRLDPHHDVTGGGRAVDGDGQGPPGHAAGGELLGLLEAARGGRRRHRTGHRTRGCWCGW